MASSKSRRDTRTAPTKTSSSRKYLDALLSSPSRVFLADIIYANIGKYITDSKPLTNKNFTPEAIETLRTIAENKGLAPGESIRVTDEDYNQYGSEFDYNIRRGQTSPDLFTKLGNLSPADELKYVIGQAVIKMDDAGNIKLKDQYDFNFYADFEKGEVLTPEEFDAAGISLKDALVSSWENRPDNMSFAENVGFLLGSRDYEGTEKDTARKVEIDLGNISEPFEVERPKEPTKTVGSKGRKKSPVVAEVLQEQFSPTRPKARPEGLVARPKQNNEKIESLSKEIVEYFETLPERDLAPETSLRPMARPEEDTEIAKLAEDIEEYLDNPLTPVSSSRPVARPERTTSSENKEMSKLFGEVEQYLDNPLAPTRSLRPVAKPEGLPSTQEDTAVETSLRPKMRPSFSEGGLVESSNPLEMDAEDFEFYIKEMGYDSTDPKKAKFLRDEWTKANTLGGKAASAYEEATAVPEGRTRMGILPFTKPEGMTGKEAILSGQTELAFPGFMTGVGEELSKTVTTGEKVTSGISTTQEELDQAALTLGELAMVATVPTTAPSGSVRSGLGVTKKKSQINPLFKPKEGDRPSATITFYSPLRSAIQEMQFSDKGKLGQEIMAYLNKRAPNVSKGELEFSQLNLDPKKRYNKQDVLDRLKYSTEDVTARYFGSLEAQYKNVQVQKLVDPQTGYFELTLEAKDVPQSLSTHHTEKTLAHSRSTVHTDSKGEKYIVINELQSDALQKVNRESTGELAELENVFDPLEAARITGENIKQFADADVDQDILDFGVARYREGTPFNELKRRYKEVFGLDVNGGDPIALSVDALRQTAVRGENFDEYEFVDMLEDLYFDVAQENTSALIKGIPSRAVPFKTNTEYVKNLILANIGMAKKTGINKIVIPPLDEIARLRAKDFEGGFEGAKKALGPTYVNAVKKAVNILNSEYGGKIKVGSTELRYPDLTKESKERVVSGKELDITDFDFDPAKQKARFAEGGLAMDDQMDKLFMARGGLKDDGMNMDPVSGNEVPPGSLAQEVRDDIPAQLSDGEYVVPADVVRYYGVKFFEDLRQEAKTGLSDMEMNGRIGGEPAPDMAGGNAAPTMIGGMPARDIPPEMLAEMARQGQAPTQMAEGGMASRLLQGNSFFGKIGSLLGEKRAEELAGKSAKAISEPSFKSDTPTFNPLDYMAGYPGIVGSSTLGQIGATLPGYTYRYIDPITGKTIPVAPGTTPPPNAVPAPAESVEPFDPYEGRDDRPTPEVIDPIDYDPTNINGVNFVDPMAGVDAALDASFGEKAVVAGVGLFGGPILGGAAAGISQVRSLAEARANLEIIGEKYGLDSTEYKTASDKIQKKADSVFIDNLVPKAWQDGDMIAANARKKYQAYLDAGGTDSTVTGGSPKDKPSGGPRVTSTGGGGGTRYRDESDAEERVRELGGEGDINIGKTSGGVRTVSTGGGGTGSYGVSVTTGSAAPQTGTRPSDSGATRTSTAYSGVPTSPEDGYNKGGLMKRKSPLKRK